MEKLGLDRILAPYETQPWFFYDDEKGITCSAEVRMGPRYEDVEAEVQFIKDEDDSEGEGESGGYEQIMRLRAEPSVAGAWTTKQLRVKGKNLENLMYNWEEKGCDFFYACVQSMLIGELPDIENLAKQHLHNKEGEGGGRRGRVGRKSPKMSNKKGMGMKA